MHETADGRRFLVLHGDEFDSVIKASPLLEALGNRAYAFVLRLNRYVNFFRRTFGFPYWSIAAYLKHKVKNAVKYIANFERALARRGAATRSRRHDLRSHPSRRDHATIDGVLYCNDGDWVESCTTLTEDFERAAVAAALDRTQRSRRRTPARSHRAARTGGVKIAIVTDAWRPQTNGVVQTLSTTAERLRTLRSRRAA